MSSNRPLVLSIAGFDPSGGAGLIADCKVFEMLKVQGMSVCTAITFQNESDFEGVKWISLDEIERQLFVLFKKYTFDFVKIGLIESLSVLEKIVDLVIEKNSKTKIIWDPILKASAGFGFHTNIKTEQIKNICSKLYLVTPNAIEMEQLIESVESKESKAVELSKSCLVLVTGGHNVTTVAEDILIKDGIKQPFVGTKIENGEKHGSGCVLSSSILSYLAIGLSIEEACMKGKLYTSNYLSSNKGLIGYHNN